MGAPQHTLDHVANSLSCAGGPQLNTPWPVNQPWVENLVCCYVYEREDKKPVKKLSIFPYGQEEVQLHRLLTKHLAEDVMSDLFWHLGLFFSNPLFSWKV